MGWDGVGTGEVQRGLISRGASLNVFKLAVFTHAKSKQFIYS